MKAVVQRVVRAEVRSGGASLASVGPGALVLVGISRDDDHACAQDLARRVATTRFLEGEGGRMNVCLEESRESEVLAVPQITLCGEVADSGRVSFDTAARAGPGRLLFDAFVTCLRGRGIRVATGRFGARMQVELIHDGPVTWILEDRVRSRGSRRPGSSQVFP